MKVVSMVNKVLMQTAIFKMVRSWLMQSSDNGGRDGISPAPGVMHTRPVIMPCTAPITDGFPKKKTSRSVHMSKLVDAQICVLSTAMDESILAEYGAPPLKPDHPSHSSPAPASTRSILFGGNRSLSAADLGPTCVLQDVRTIDTEMER